MRMATYRDACARGYFEPKMGASTVPSVSDADEKFYIFQPEDKLPDNWVFLMIGSQNGPVPEDEWLRRRGQEEGYKIFTPCSGMASLVYDEETWCPSMFRKTVLFSAEGTGDTVADVNRKLFYPLANLDTMYAVAGVFAASDALKGDTQSIIDSNYTLDRTGAAVADLGEKVADAAVAINEKIVDAITPDPPSFWNWKTKLAVGALVVGAGFAAWKWGIPAWRKMRGRRQR